MFYRIALVVLVVLSLATVRAPLAAAEPGDTDRSAPTIAFSEDEKMVDLKLGKKEWKLPRPVVSPWKYKATGKVYWVSPDGSDADIGTETKPFKTLKKGLAAATAGDVVYAQPGVYREYLEIRKSGKEGAPLILSCAPGALGKVKLQPPETPNAKGLLLSGITLLRDSSGSTVVQYVWINGFIIEGARGLPKAPRANDSMTGTCGITWADKSGVGCRATNNVVYWNVHCGLKELHHGGKGILLEGNIVFDNGSSTFDHGIYMPADDATINGNIVFNNASFGIHSYPDPKDQVISRNVCFGNPSGGIIMAGSASKICYNTCAYSDRGLFYYAGTCKNNLVEDNVFAFNKTDCVYGDGGVKLGAPSGNTDDHNCYFPGKPAAKIGPAQNEVLSDPQFLDGENGDFRLKPTSPCLGAGRPAGLPAEKKEPNLGAF
jgi:hypothetical protein